MKTGILVAAGLAVVAVGAVAVAMMKKPAGVPIKSTAAVNPDLAAHVSAAQQLRAQAAGIRAQIVPLQLRANAGDRGALSQVISMSATAAAMETQANHLLGG